jgi:hypothetical protein
MLLRKVIILVFLLQSFLFPIGLFAADFNSNTYQVRDPVLQPAGFGTSSNFKLLGTLSEPAIGTSSAVSFEAKAGFLYFPFATAPTPTATAGDSQVDLSWTASTGFLGWTISSYSVGQSITPGGPYTYSSVGNVLSSSRGSLTNGVTYYFVIRAKDYFGNFVATSSEVSATPVASASGGNNTGGGGGGGGPIIGYIPPLNQELKECSRIADLNCDGYVDLIDFSIMYYWFDKSSPPKRVDLRLDGRIDIYDFSVMAFYWDERPDITN